MTREPIYQALFELVSNSVELTTTSRKLLHWGDVKPSAMPAMFQAQRNETPTTPSANGLPVVWNFLLDIYIYTSTQGALSPGEVMNPIVDVITDLLAPPTGGVQTLGGLVQWVRIDGTIETDEGTLGDKAVSIIPIRILV